MRHTFVCASPNTYFAHVSDVVLYNNYHRSFVHNAAMGDCTMIAVLAITLVGLLECGIASPLFGACTARGENSTRNSTIDR